MDFGLDQADKIASVVGAVIAAIALIVTVRGTRERQPPASPHTAGVPRPSVPGAGSSAKPAIWLIAVLALLCTAPSWFVYVVSAFVASSADDQSGRPARTTPASPAPPASPAVLWKGEIRLDATPRDFDHEPPARGNTSTDLSSDAYLNGSVYSKFWGRAVVLWPGQGDPSRDDCTARLRTHGVRAVNIDVRSRICLETNQGRIVYIKVLRRNGTDGYDSRVTLWSSG